MNNLFAIRNYNINFARVLTTLYGYIVEFCMDNRTIRHCGVVTHTDGRRVRVKCLRVSACDSCGHSHSCATPKGKEFYVDAFDSVPGQRRVGDRVVVETAADNGRSAIMLGFVLPLLAFLLALFAAKSVWHSDTISALCGLGVCAVYYLLLYAMRNKLNRKFRFVISDNNLL